MPTMVLRFPGGRYHATPGGHHVNEGIVEWPPSPWRLVRALIACGFATQHWVQVPPEGRRLFESLSRELPTYRLPQAALGHSRHYMPLAKMKDGREETTLVLDTFAHVGDGELWVRWPSSVDSQAQMLFDVLVRSLGYLGRSESWVLGESVADDAPLPHTGRAFPHTNERKPGRGYEQIAVTAPDTPEEYASWRSAEVDAALRELNIPEGRRTQAQQKKIAAAESVYPPDLVECLQLDSTWWRSRKWSRAPGTRTVVYWRESNALEVAPVAARHGSHQHHVEVMLLALTTPSGSKSALPMVRRTLPQAELLHRALVSKLGFEGEPCPEIVGRDASGEPLKGHSHAHLLPLDLDGDGRLDHFVIFANSGLSVRAQAAVRDVRRTFSKRGVTDLQIAVAGAGDLGGLYGVHEAFSRPIQALLGSPSLGSATWTSTTPFVPPRHLKKTGRSSLLGQVEEELRVRDLPSARVELLDRDKEPLSFRHFVRRRQRGPQPPLDAGFAIRLVFERPVQGPICLGYGSHFGLGLFGATDDVT